MSADELRRRTERNMQRFGIPKGIACPECGGSGVWQRKDALYPCAVCAGAGLVRPDVCNHDWRKTENPYSDEHRFKCTRCGKVEYVERAD